MPGLSARSPAHARASARGGGFATHAWATLGAASAPSVSQRFLFSHRWCAEKRTARTCPATRASSTCPNPDSNPNPNPNSDTSNHPTRAAALAPFRSPSCRHCRRTPHATPVERPPCGREAICFWLSRPKAALCNDRPSLRGRPRGPGSCFIIRGSCFIISGSCFIPGALASWRASRPRGPSARETAPPFSAPAHATRWSHTHTFSLSLSLSVSLSATHLCASATPRYKLAVAAPPFLVRLLLPQGADFRPSSLQTISRAILALLNAIANQAYRPCLDSPSPPPHRMPTRRRARPTVFGSSPSQTRSSGADGLARGVALGRCAPRGEVG